MKTKCGKTVYNRVYLDNQATTCIDPRVLDSMMPYLTHAFGNPHSRTHSYGWEAENAVEEARTSVASLLNCEKKNIIFTSGATESNNLAIKGSKSFYGNLDESSGRSKKNHIITTQIEHKCVLQCCRQLENEGYSVTYLKPDKNGIISPEEVRKHIRPETFLCSVIHVNNEIGVIQNIEAIGKICREHKVIFHTDAAQSFGKMPIDLKELQVDLLSISGHKIYGPKGVGALFVRTKPRIRLQPVIDGGGQERGLRSGTLPTALVVGLGAAAKVASREMERDSVHVEKIFKKLYEGLSQIDKVSVNGSVRPGERYYGNLNMSFEFIEGESLLMSLSKFALSSVGSACTSSSLEPSYVLRSLDIGEELAHTSIRFGIGRFTTESEADEVVEAVKEVVKRLRDLSPLYEMYLENQDKNTMVKMNPKGKWIFKCLGCKNKDEDDTEYVDLSKIRDVDEIIHINDLVVSKPDLYVERPNIVYIEKKQLSEDGRSFAEIKPTIAIPIENKWPQKRTVVPLSNVPGLLNREYKNQHMTISESIAIAENIYQNERRQMMNLGKDDERVKTFQYLDGDRLNLNEYKSGSWNKNKVEEYTFSDDESTRGTISRSRNKINEYQEDQLTHICYMSDYSEDEESLTEKIWNMFKSNLMDSRDSSENSDIKNEAEPTNDEVKEEVKQSPELEEEVAKSQQIWYEIKKKLTQCSQILAKGENVSYCSVGGLDSGLPLVPDEQGQLPQNDSAPNDLVTPKFGQEFYPESIIPGFYTWFQGDGSVVRYVMDFVMYTYRGDRFVPLEHLGRYETKIVMYCKVKHIGLVHTAEDLLETNHPWTKSFKNRKKVELSEGLLKVPRKQRYFSSKVVLVDWYFDVGTSEEATPHIWVVSDNDVHYKLDRPTGGYYNSFAPAKLLFDLSTRVVKEMQSGKDKSFGEVLLSMTSPPTYKSLPSAVFKTESPAQKVDRGEEGSDDGKPQRIRIEDTEELTVWGAPVSIHGSSMVDVYRNLDFIFNEVRYYYTFFGGTEMETYLSEMVQKLKEQSPFHYFDANFMKLEYMAKNALANRYKDRLFVQKLDYPNTGSIIKPLKLARLTKRGPKQKRFNLEEYNNQYNMNDVKSRSGRVIRNKAVSEIEPAVRKHVVQTESQKKEEYRKAVELEAKCDGLLLPFDFEWSNYNTCSEVSDDATVPAICNDVDVALDNARYYPRDIPLRTLKFYGNDEIVDLLDLTRQFSVPSLSSSPLLPKMSFVQLEANLIFNSSLYEYRPSELSSFEITTPQCLCNNKRFNSIYDDINSEASALSARDKLKDLMPDDEEFEDGMQWIYYLNKNIIDEGDVEYPEDLDEGSIGRLYVGLMEELRRAVENSGFERFVQNLRESGELSDKKKEVQERELGVAISDAEIALDFINTNGGCLYKGRFKRIGQDPESTLPYVNTSRWNKRFKKFQRVVTVSGNYRYSTISHSHDPDGFTVFDSNRPKICPLDLVYGLDGLFKASKEEGDKLPTFRKTVNVWKKELPQQRKSKNQIKEAVNKHVRYYNKFVQSYAGAKLKPNKKMEASAVDKDYFMDYMVDGIEDMTQGPVLGFGYKELETICKNEYIMAEEMLTEYTWHTLLKVYLFYALYSTRTSYKFKFNSVVWGDASLYNSFAQGYGQDEQKNDRQKSEYNYDEEMIDTEKLKLLEDIGYEDFEPSNSGVEEDQSKEDEEEEEEEVEGYEADEGGEDKDRVGRRGWGMNRYCPYYDFELEWHPDAEKLERLSKGRISGEFVKEAFLKLRKKNFFQLELHERLSLLLWLGDILGYSVAGKSFIDDRNDEFYYLRTQLMRSEDDKKGPKRLKGSSRDLMELEERYLQKPVLLGYDRFYNAYYYFGLEYERRIYVQTMPQMRFVQNRIVSRSKYLRAPKYKADMFNLDLSDFAQKFAQDRIFTQTKGKRGRKKEVHDEGATSETTSKRKKRGQGAVAEPLNETADAPAAATKSELKSPTSEGINDSNTGMSTPNESGLHSVSATPFNTNTSSPTPVSNKLGPGSPEKVGDQHGEVKRSGNQSQGANEVKKEETIKQGGYKENLDAFLTSTTNANDAASKDDESVKKRRIKNRSRNRPKVRRSRQVFDRHPTNFRTVEEYLNYLTVGPARLSWCVIDTHKSLKRFITRLSQFTTNEKHLALKLAQVEPDFTLPTFEIVTYKCPTVVGEMLLSLLRGLYRYYKNVFTKMVLSTVVLNKVRTDRYATSSHTLKTHHPDLTKRDATRINQASVTVNAHLGGSAAHQVFTKTVSGSLASSPEESDSKRRLQTSTQSLNEGNSPNTYANTPNTYANTPNTYSNSDSNSSGIPSGSDSDVNGNFNGNVNGNGNGSNGSSVKLGFGIHKDGAAESGRMSETAGSARTYGYLLDPTASSPNKTIAEKLSKSYNSGLFLNLYVSDLLKTCLTLCVSDIEGNKKCLKTMLELMYFFEFVAHRYYNDGGWSQMRNEWRLNLDAIYTLLQVDMTAKKANQKNQLKAVGEHNANCYVYNNNSGSSSIVTAVINTPQGNMDLIPQVEKSGLWFRFFEVYCHDKSVNFDMNTSVNYAKFMEGHNAQTALRKNGQTPTGVDGNAKEVEGSSPEKLDLDELAPYSTDLFEFLSENKVNDSLVFFSGGLLELITSVNDMLQHLKELLGIKVQVETSKPKGTKAKTKRRKKKKDKDEESDSALTDVESNIDISDMYQDLQPEPAESKEELGADAMEDQSPIVTPMNEQKDQTPEKTDSGYKSDTPEKTESGYKSDTPEKQHSQGKTDSVEKQDLRDSEGEMSVKREEAVESDQPSNGNSTYDQSPLAHDSQYENGGQDTQTSQPDESKPASSEKRERDDKGDKGKKTKKAKMTKGAAAEESQQQEEEESSNEIEGGQKEGEQSKETNNEELLEPIKKLLAKLELAYQLAPKETCEIKVLTMTSNLLKVDLPPKTAENTPENQTDDEDGKSVDHAEESRGPSIEILCLNLTVSSMGYEADSEGEDEDLSESLGLVKNLRRVCRTLSRVEKTRATRRATEEPGLTPRAPDGSPPRVFTLTVPVALRAPGCAQFPQYVQPYEKVFSGLTYLWRTPLKCKNAKTNQTGVIKKTNYTSLDIWKCVSVEWNDNKKEQVAHNPWELTI
nr:cysteine desulfurase [Theileria orientalis]